MAAKGRPKKDEPTAKEAEFAKYMVENQASAVEAARAVFGWKCEAGSKESRRALDLAATRRVMVYQADLARRLTLQSEATKVVSETRKLDTDTIRTFLISKLEEIRDSSNQKAQVRLNAIQALERMRTPGGDLALLVKWMEALWRLATAHCPACHTDFALKKLPNPAVEAYRKEKQIPPPVPEEDRISCRLDFLNSVDRRREPHPGQRRIIAYPERHGVLTAPARCGKSVLMSMFAVMSYVIPGSDNWIISEKYSSSHWEVTYFKQMLKSLFHPNDTEMVSMQENIRDGEFRATSRWGSNLLTRTAKSKGSITGSELNLALVAEAGWVPDDIYEEVRARVSSRLGRILAFGTPKGSQRFLVRMMRASGRDPVTKKIIRLTPEERLIKNGCAWSDSVFIDELKPAENPSYVLSELNSARKELTDEEYASEFEGKVVERAGAKFHEVKQQHCAYVSREFFSRAVFVLGVDQGPTNFAAELLAWDGDTIVPCYEFFDNSEVTMRANLMFLMDEVPKWIRHLGGDPAAWKLSIFDRDPPVFAILDELADEGKRWPTELSVRHENKRTMNDNWRRDTQEYINVCAKLGKLVFLSDEGLTAHSDDRCAPGAVSLHQEVLDVLDRPDGGDNEQSSINTKGWIVSNPWRKDHPLDAWLLAMWAFYSGQVKIKTKEKAPVNDFYAHARQQAQNDLASRERNELKTYRLEAQTDLDINTPLARPSIGVENWETGWSGAFYSDES